MESVCATVSTVAWTRELEFLYISHRRVAEVTQEGAWKLDAPDEAALLAAAQSSKGSGYSVRIWWSEVSTTAEEGWAPLEFPGKADDRRPPINTAQISELGLTGRPVPVVHHGRIV
jgi:hypothetical protein